VFLMAAGVGVFGTFSGLVASWFLTPAAEETESDLGEVRRMLTELTARLEMPPYSHVAAASQVDAKAPNVGPVREGMSFPQVVSDAGPPPR
jgi:hypothetical protein